MPGDTAAPQSAAPMRIILIRHGRPAIPTAPRTSHREFRTYIDDYEQAGLDPESVPPDELAGSDRRTDGRVHQRPQALP